MKNKIVQGLSKTGSQIMVLTLFIFLISSCSNSNSVVSRRSFSKRKYTSGYFNSKRKIPRSKETHLAKTEFTKVNEIKLQSPKTINSRPIPNMEIAISELTISESISKSEFASELKQEKSKPISNLLAETDIITLPDQTSSFERLSKANESNSNQVEKRKQRFGHHSLESFDAFLVSLGIGILFGIPMAIMIPGTVVFYIVAAISLLGFLVAGACFIIMPLEYVLDAIF